MAVDNNALIAEYYSQHWKEVVEYIDGRIKNKAEAEDLAQELFAKLLSPSRPLSAVTLSSLVYTMARNAAADCWRRRACRKQTTLVDTFYADSTPETICSYHEAIYLYEQGMGTLRKEECSMIRMNIECGKQVGEISRYLSLGYKQAEYRLGVARKQIRSFMSKRMAM